MTQRLLVKRYGWLPGLVLGLLLLVGCGGEANDAPANNAPTATRPSAASNPTLDEAGISGQTDSTDTPPLAATVNGERITLAEFQSVVDALQASDAFQPADLDAFETEVLNMMIDQILIEQFAAANGLLVSDEEVAQEVALLNELAAENDLSLSQVIGYPETMVEEKVRETLITQQVSQYVTEDMPVTMPQVHARHILVKDEATARDVLRQLEEGASFAELARQYSQDPSTAQLGGDLGWVSRGDLLQQEVEDVIFQMPANARWPEPVASVLGYHIVESLERVEDRPLDDTRRAERRQEIFAQWLADQRAAADIEYYVDQPAGGAS